MRLVASRRSPSLRARSTARATALSTALAGALAVALALPAGPVSAVVPGEQPTRTVTYDVRVRGQVQTDVGAFARESARTLHDRRGWSAGGSVRFRQVASGGAFTLWLAAPSQMWSFSPVCSAQYSCRVGRAVVLNDERWRTGTPTWPTVREYRRYVLNHEVGHWLGLGHVSCPRAGAPAPVMVQQSKGVGACRTSTWPTDTERRAAAAGLGVAVRSRVPALVAVDAAAPGGTSVVALAGATGHRTVLSRSTTALPPTAGRPWTFRLADHDRDGVEDLYAVEHGPTAPVRVRVLDGSSGFRTVLLDAVTPLRVTDPDRWTFLVADADGDGHLDLHAVDGQGATGTEVHVLDGASALRTWRLHAATPLHRTGAGAWSFTLGDRDRDGVADLYAVSSRGRSGRTEVHVLSGAGGFRRWLAHTATPLGPSRPADWSFTAADDDGDGFDELVAVQRRGASGGTEVHVLDRTLTRWVRHAATALAPTDTGDRWSFDVA